MSVAPATPAPAVALDEVSGLALLARIPQLILDPLSGIGAALAGGADLVDFRFAGRSAALVNDAALVQEVLRASRRFTKPTLGTRFTLWFGGEGLPPPSEFRDLARAGFAPRRVDEMLPDIDRATRALEPRLEYHALTGRPIDIARAAMRAAVLASGFALFGTDLRVDADRLVDALDEIQRYYLRQGPRIALGLPDVVRTPSSARVRRAAGELRAVTTRLIERSVPHRGDRLLDLLLHNSRRNPSFSPTMVENIVMSALLSSFETTGCALGWTFALLAEHPEHAAAIASEAGRHDCTLDVDRLARAVHTKAVIREALRLYPPSWIILREAPADTALGDHPIRSGSTVMVSPYWVHRDARRWPNPWVFDPRRFGASSTAPEPGSYIPFGAGGHACFGERFALHVAHVVLLRLVGRYELHRATDTALRPHALISLSPQDPVLVRLVRREA